MSIIIKNMGMPKNCAECAIKSWDEEGYVCPFSGIPALNIGRQNNCPLMEFEPKTGKWVKDHRGWCTPGGDPVWVCSECGKGTHVYGIEHGTYGSDVADDQWVACPNCGAIMESTVW